MLNEMSREMFTDLLYFIQYTVENLKKLNVLSMFSVPHHTTYFDQILKK